MLLLMKKKPDDIKQIENRIANLQKKEKQVRDIKSESDFVFATKTGFRVGTELLSGVLVGAGLGYVLDVYLHTSPWFLIVLSDGRPNDQNVNRPGVPDAPLYTGDYAVKDTAIEVRRASRVENRIF